MVRHDGITQHWVSILIEDCKEFIHFIISFGKINEVKPFITGKRNKINTCSFYESVNSHMAK